MNDTYRWDPKEGVLGVVGVAPAATIDFYRRLTRLTPALKDWQHPRVLIDSNPKIPSRGRHFELGEADPSPFIRESINRLADQGATIVVVPCNTAHALYGRFAADVRVEVPNMIEVALAEVARRFEAARPRRVAVLGSRLTLHHNLYGDRLRSVGGEVRSMDDVQAEVSALIEYVKQGGDARSGQVRLRAVVDACVDADCFIVGCTELSSLAADLTFSVPVIDSNEELARYCLALIRPKSPVVKDA